MIAENSQERENVIAERKRSEQQNQGTTRIDEQTSGEKQAEQLAIERIENMRRRKIEMLIVAELIREKTVRDGVARKQRRDEQSRAIEEETRKRQQADQERRAEKT
jgi:hypothetical protein